MIHGVSAFLTEIDSHAPPCPLTRLSQRLDRRPVGGDRADDPRGGAWRATAQGGQARDRGGDPLRPSGELRIAAIAARLPALADSLLLPPPLAAGGVWARVHHTLVMAEREREGRDSSPSAAVIDSQTVRRRIKSGTQRLQRRKADLR